MVWQALVSLGLNAASAISADGVAAGNAAASNIVNKANTEASTLMRAANNNLLSKRNQLARSVQNENNSRALKQTGRGLEADSINYRRARDAAATGDLENQIGAAEQAGAQAAAAAYSGLTGGVADAVTQTSALRLSRIAQATKTATAQSDWDAGRRQGDILTAGLQSLDQSFITDDLDYSLDVFTAQRSSTNAFGAVMGSLLANPGATQAAIGGVSGFFSTPNAFADRAGALGSGSGGRSRTIAGGR